MILNCWDCGGRCVRCNCAPCSDQLNPCGVFCYCPYCKKHPMDFFQNKTEWKKDKASCMVILTEKKKEN